MKLLECVENLSYKDLALFDDIYTAIENRISWTEEREPEYDGSVHDEWDDKIEALNEMIECIDNIHEVIEEAVTEFKDLVTDYQYTYGGLSRITVDLK